MPIPTPSGWNSESAPAADRGPFGDGCANITCVDVQLRADGVHVTSTIDGNDGRVVFTHDEWDAFIPDVKAGRWDHTVTEVAVPA